MTTASQRAGIAAAATLTSDTVAARLRDYVTLTKPRIISLLLVTTLVPMVIAGAGWPGYALVWWTLLGGYLMAGGANALNMAYDRDIDARMGRTSLRPIPSGRMSAGQVLAFGTSLAAVAFLTFWFLVNPLSALLAAAGFVYYVFVYTGWLKRRTPQNIVIGGGAGAFPVLVGWAAVTETLALTPILLFLVVVLWTPPHFWALALIKQREYARAGVPMAPNVWGEERTIRQMIGYAALLVVVTLIPVSYGALGVTYAGFAVMLGGWFLLDLRRLATATVRTAPAWRVYKTSLLYLALLFAAMAADVSVTQVLSAFRAM